MQHLEKCPICGTPGPAQFTSAKDWLVTGSHFNILRCRSCMFTFTQDYPDESESGRYYESAEYISHTDSKRTFIEKIYQVARNYMLGRKVRLVSSVTGKKHGSLLDIGSGTGHFLNSMKLAGWEVTGIEISDNARSYSVSKFSLTVLKPTEFEKIASGSIDCITLWHVAEHLHDLDGYFSDIKRVLKTGGVIIIALPNSESYDAFYYGSDWAAWDVPRHLWHFNPASFRIFAKNKGLRLIKIRPLPLDVFYIAILSERNRGKRFPAVKGIIKGFLFYVHCIFRREFSSSLVYILKREGDQ